MKFALMKSKNDEVKGDYPCYIRFKVESEEDFLAAYAVANYPIKRIARFYSETDRPKLAGALLAMGKNCFFDVLKREGKLRGVSFPLKPFSG